MSPATELRALLSVSVVQLIAFALKLAEFIHASWWWVFAPTFAFVLAAMLLDPED